jgi:hypothetical protein
MTIDLDNLLTSSEAAALLKCNRHFLYTAAMRKTGPDFLRIGRSVRYQRQALIDWISNQNYVSPAKNRHAA